MANGPDKPTAQTARDIGVNENTLPTWASKYSGPVENAKAVRTGDHLYDELGRLKEGVAQLAGERGLLAKAAAHFAKGQLSTAGVQVVGHQQ